MASTTKAPLWRGRFLRALGRHANARLAAREAGVDHSSAYALRKRDADFAGRWEKAVAKGRAALDKPSPRPSPASGRGRKEDFIVRHSKRGSQLVRVGEGRWSGKAEAAFLADLRVSGCVRRAAEAAGFSTTALYNRREADAGFAARWDAAIEQAKVHLRSLVLGAGIAAFDPAPAEGERPKVTVAEAIAILRLKDGTGPAASSRGIERYAPPARTIEQVRESILSKLDAIEAAERRKEG